MTVVMTIRVLGCRKVKSIRIRVKSIRIRGCGQILAPIRIRGCGQILAPRRISESVAVLAPKRVVVRVSKRTCRGLQAALGLSRQKVVRVSKRTCRGLQAAIRVRACHGGRARSERWGRIVAAVVHRA